MIEFVENWSRLAVDHLPAGLLVIDQEGRVRVFNRVITRLTGLIDGDVLGHPLLNFMHSQLPDHNKLLQTLATGREFQELKPEDIIPVIGSTVFAASTHVIRDKSGVTMGAMAVFLPVGRQQELENAVMKAEKLAILGQLAAGMVHEIRNPLTVIGGFLQLVARILKGKSQGGIYIHNID